MSIRLIEQKIGAKWVITSPDVPELHISHADLKTAQDSVTPALELLQQMNQRTKARQAVEKIQHEQNHA